MNLSTAILSACGNTHSSLEVVNLVIRYCVGLGNNGNKVDLGVQLLHDLNIERLERVAGRLDEVNNSVDTVVNNIHAVDLVLSIKVGIKSLLNVLNNRIPRFVVVDEVTESGCINDGQSEADAVLLDVGANGLYRDSLGDIDARRLALLGRVQGGVEQCVYKGRLSEARFTCRIVSAPLIAPGADANIPTTITLKLKPLRTLLRCHWLGRFAKPT